MLAGCARDEGEASPARPRNGGPGGGRPRGATPVEIMVARVGRVERTTTLAGTIEPVRVVGVNAQLSGALASVRVREGAAVREGDVLAQVDALELEAQLRSAEAALVFAQSTARRSEQLNRERIITAAEYERDRAALAAAEATLAQLKTRLGFASIRAPIGGVITERLVETGDIVSGNQRLFTVADVSTLVTRVLVSELDVGALRPGHAVQVSVDAVPGERFTGRIRRVFPSADSATRMIPVEVEINRDAGGRLKPGFTARSTFQLAVRDDAVLLPTRAVLGTSGARHVFVFTGGHAARRDVRVGMEANGNLEILAGVTAGDTVIVTGASDLREGAEVRIVEPLAPDVPGGAAPRVAPATPSSPDSTRVPRRP